jgi:hypothetical protein
MADILRIPRIAPRCPLSAAIAPPRVPVIWSALAMPLQNRVTPFGDLIATQARGLLMGNRGQLHDADRRIVRYAQGRRWIACLTSFRGRRRVVMSPRSYTELFFLDEAVALAAGHRPCAECRRDDYARFQSAWSQAALGNTSADAMDGRLHADRLVGPGRRKFYRESASALPDGAYVEIGGDAWLLWNGALRRWSPAGYGQRRDLDHDVISVITPRCLVDVLRAGYRTSIHPTADR